MSYDDTQFAEELVETSMPESGEDSHGGGRRQEELATSLAALFTMFGGQVMRPADGRA